MIEICSNFLREQERNRPLGPHHTAYQTEARLLLVAEQGVESNPTREQLCGLHPCVRAAAVASSGAAAAFGAPASRFASSPTRDREREAGAIARSGLGTTTDPGRAPST